VQHDDDPQNVFALFPGIDTAPFGRAADTEALSDDGWSAVVKPTIALEAVSGAGSGARRWPTRAAAIWIALALVVGAGIAVGRTLLTVSGPAGLSHVIASVQTHRSASIAAGGERAQVIARLRAALYVSHSRPVIRRAASGRTHSHAIAHGQPASEAASTPASSGPSYTPVTTAVTAGTGDGERESPTAEAASSQSARPAGPRGPVSLIGAGTTPSG
jgi:hypothetical protein